MLDDIFKNIEQMVSTSIARNPDPPKKPSKRWKYCIALKEKGWTCKSCVKTEKEDCHDIYVTWSKDGQNDIVLVLTLEDQCAWIDYKEREK